MRVGACGSQSGFSLIEMVIALGIFALIGVAGLSLVDSILTAQRRTEGRLARVGQLERAMRLLALDLQDAAPETLAFDAGSLVFTRRNDEGRPVSLRYGLNDHVLARAVETTRVQPVLDGVSQITWRFHLPGMGWRDTVVVENHRAPDGIELDLVTAAEGPIRRVVDLRSTP